jgi:mono/diheme cytochrome c family protein
MKRVAVVMAVLSLMALPLMAEDGAAIFKSKCAMCHGPDGAGQTTMGKNMKLRDLGSADVQKQSDADLAKIVTDGKGKMPAYKGKIEPAGIDALVKYIRTLKK